MHRIATANQFILFDHIKEYYNSFYKHWNHASWTNSVSIHRQPHHPKINSHDKINCYCPIGQPSLFTTFSQNVNLTPVLVVSNKKYGHLGNLLPRTIMDDLELPRLPIWRDDREGSVFLITFIVGWWRSDACPRQHPNVWRLANQWDVQLTGQSHAVDVEGKPHIFKVKVADLLFNLCPNVNWGMKASSCKKHLTNT